MSRSQFASGLQQLAFSSSNVAVIAGGSTTASKTYYLALQGENPAGVNLLSTIVGPFTVAAGQSLQVSLPPTIKTDSDGWLDYVISASTSNDPLTFVQLGKVATRNSSGVVVELPTSITFSSDAQLTLSASVNTPTELPATPVHGMLRGVMYRDDGITPLNAIFEYNANATIPTNGITVLAAATGRWIYKPGTFSTYITATTEPGGCDQAINGLNNAAVRTAKYACDGSAGTPIKFWILNDEDAAIPSGKRIGLSVTFNEQAQSSLFEGLLWVKALGYANATTGALRKAYSDGTPFSGLDNEVIFENKKTDLILQDDLQPGEAVAIQIYPNFRTDQLNGQILNRAVAKLSFGFYEQAGAYVEAWFITGDWIYNQHDRGVVVPDTGAAVTVLRRSGLVARQSFLNQPATDVPGLAANTADQQIRINGNGSVYRGVGTKLDTEAIRAFVSLEPGVSTASDWSAPIALSGSSGIRITLNYPSNGTTATVRANYPDQLLAGNTKAKLNAPLIRVYIRSGSTIKQFSGFALIDGATQAIDLTDWNSGTVIGSLPTAPSSDFCLFQAVSATAIANAPGNFPSGIEVAYAFEYTGGTVSSISHEETRGCISTASVTLADMAQASKYWAAAVWDAMALRQVPANSRFAGQSRVVIGLRKPYIWNPASTIADDGSATSVALQPDDVPPGSPGRWLIDDSSNLYHSSQFSASGGIPASSFGEARDYCIDDVEESPTFGTLFYKSGDNWVTLCVLRGPTGPKGLSFILLSRDPIASDGIDGDAAFNSDSRDLFYKANGTWVFNRNLRDIYPRGNWSSITSYKVNDVVLYNRNLWRSLGSHTNITPVEGASWTLFLQGGQDGVDGQSLQLVGTYSNLTTYSYRQQVRFEDGTANDGSYVYISLTPSAGNAPPNLAYWQRVAEDGANGEDGEDGANAYSTLAASFTQPAVGDNVIATLPNTGWMAVGANIFIPVGGYYEIVAVSGPTSSTLKNLGYSGGAASGVTIASGSLVTPAGDRGATGAVGAVSAASAVLLQHQATDPATGPGETALYAKTDGKTYTREENNGAVTEVGAGGPGGGGGGIGPFTEKTEDYVCVASDQILANTQAGPITLTLPGTATFNEWVNVLGINNTTNKVRFASTAKLNGKNATGAYLAESFSDLKFLYKDVTTGWIVYPSSRLKFGELITANKKFHMQGTKTDVVSGNVGAVPGGETSPTEITASSNVDGNPVLRFSSFGSITFPTFMANTTGATLYIVYYVDPNLIGNNYEIIRTNDSPSYWYYNGTSYFGHFRTDRPNYPASLPKTGLHIVSIHSAATTYEVVCDGVSSGQIAGTYQQGDRFNIGHGFDGSAGFQGDIAELVVFGEMLTPGGASHAQNMEFFAAKYPSLTI